MSYGFCVADNPHDGVNVSLVTHFPSASRRAAGVLPTRETFVVRRGDAGGVPVELLYALKKAGVAMRRITAVEAGAEDDDDDDDDEEVDEEEAGEEEAGEEAVDEELVLGSDEVELLLGTLHERYMALEGHAKADCKRLRRHAAALSGRSDEGAASAGCARTDKALRKRKRADEASGADRAAAEEAGVARADSEMEAGKAEAAMRRLSVAMYRQGTREVLQEAMAALEELMGDGGESGDDGCEEDE